MLALDRVGKTYPNGVHALERFSAEIKPGEIVAIIGGSGCGKSTLLRAIAGLDRATTGTVTLDDAAITAPHAKIGIIFQEPRLLPWLSVADNIGFGLSDLPAACAAREGRAARWRASASPTRPRPGRANSPAGRRSAWRSRARWCRSRKCCCSTSRSPRSTPSPGATCRTICSTSGPTRGRR